MTHVDFYLHAEDKVHTAVRLAAKAFQLGRRLTVYCTDRSMAEHFDRVLWTNPAIGFIPHCDAQDKLAPATPIVIDRTGTDPQNDDVLLNLDIERPPYFSRFHRLIEIVSSEEEDKLRARDRYKFYRDRGYEIRTHDLAKSGSAR
ncbi:MAG: DNA polymerase III subunit chi [Rhodospirillaceae bacterium]